MLWGWRWRILVLLLRRRRMLQLLLLRQRQMWWRWLLLGWIRRTLPLLQLCWLLGLELGLELGPELRLGLGLGMMLVLALRWVLALALGMKRQGRWRRWIILKREIFLLERRWRKVLLLRMRNCGRLVKGAPVWWWRLRSCLRSCERHRRWSKPLERSSSGDSSQSDGGG